jgi:hypothetical protein
MEPEKAAARLPMETTVFDQALQQEKAMTENHATISMRKDFAKHR